MKKLLFLSFIIPSILLGQTSINNTHMPSSGDTLRYSIAVLDTTLLSNYQLAGPNQTWNFDSLEALRQGVYEYYSSSQTPYRFFVPNRLGQKIADTLSLGPVELLNLYDFYQNNASGFKTTHRGFTIGALPFPISQSFQDEDEVYQFPLDYQDRDSSTFQFQFNNALAGAYIENKGYRINEVDAWGTMNTPYGTYNCIRVVTDIVATDTLSFNGINVGLSSHRREYKWLTSQLKIPALKISGAVIAGIFIPATIEYRDSVRNVPSLFAPTALFNSTQTEFDINDTVSFDNLSISLLPVNYKWSISPNTFNYINNTNANTDSLFVQFTDTGYYDIQLIARNSEGADTLLRQKYIKINGPTFLPPTALFNSKLAIYEINDTVSINNESISFSPATYKWSIFPNTFNYVKNSNSNSDSLYIQFTDTGYYNVQLIATNMDGADTLTKLDFIKIVEPNSISEIEFNKSFELYPVPIKSGGNLNLLSKNEHQIISVSIYDLNGKVIQQVKNQNLFKPKIRIPFIQSGVYFLQIESNYRVFSKKILVIE